MNQNRQFDYQYFLKTIVLLEKIEKKIKIIKYINIKKNVKMYVDFVVTKKKKFKNLKFP